MVTKVDPSVTLGPLSDGPKPRNDDAQSRYADKSKADQRTMAKKLGGPSAYVCDPKEYAKGVGDLTGFTDKANLDKWAAYARKG